VKTKKNTNEAKENKTKITIKHRKSETSQRVREVSPIDEV